MSSVRELMEQTAGQIHFIPRMYHQDGPEVITENAQCGHEWMGELINRWVGGWMVDGRGMNEQMGGKVVEWVDDWKR